MSSATLPVTERRSERQVLNHAGGYVYRLKPLDQAKRFIILGSDSNNFYATAKELTVDNAKAILQVLEAGQGLELLGMIEAISLAGRAPKQGPGLFALAVVLVYTNVPDSAFTDASKEKRKVRKTALGLLGKVCRTASTMYELFVYYKLIGVAQGNGERSQMSGWGTVMRRAVADWFLDKSPMDVAVQVTKYPQRNGIAGRDLLRLAHPQVSVLGKRGRDAEVDDMSLVLGYTAHPENEVAGEGKVAEFLRDAQRLKSNELTLASEAAAVIKKHRGLGWEHVGNTKLLKAPRVWAALLDQGMGLTALIRNLSRFVKMDMFDSWKRDRDGDAVGESKSEDELPSSLKRDYLDLVCKRLTDVEQLKKGRIHPLRMLLAMKLLDQEVNDDVSVPDELKKALDTGFELSFTAVQPTGKRILLAVDVSHSMCQPCFGTKTLTAMEAAAAIAVILWRKEENVEVTCFSHGLTPFHVSAEDSVQNVVHKAFSMDFGGTDCSLPIQHALKNNLDFDAFIVLTDNETWMGKHCCALLQEYRKSREPLPEGRQPAKLMVCAFSSTGFTIADPEDAGMLDVAGLDASLPDIMRAFLMDEV